MLVYPQILSAGLAQYPLEKTLKMRNAGVRAVDGAWYARHDPGAGGSEWILSYEGLTELEAGRLQTFFDAAEGRLRAFTFVDPMRNLLKWSGDLTNAAWEKSMTSVAVGPDPNGGTEGFVLANGSGGDSGVTQWVAAPAEYRYVFSAFLRGVPGLRVLLKFGGAVRECVMDGAWRRHQLTAIPNATSNLRFSLEIEAGGVCEVFGPQAEAQQAASAYMKSGGNGAVHSSARFEMDEIHWVIEGPDQYRTKVWIRSRGEE